MPVYASMYQIGYARYARICQRARGQVGDRGEEVRQVKEGDPEILMNLTTCANFIISKYLSIAPEDNSKKKCDRLLLRLLA